MWATYLLYFFVTFISKAILALVVCFYIFPTERTCDGCDCETLPVRMGPVGRMASRLTGGRLQRRWCPRCGREGLTRAGRTAEEEQARLAGIDGPAVR
jgi:hypothetical protein